MSQNVSLHRFIIFCFPREEIFAGLAPRKARAVDLLVKAKFKESDSFFLVHTESNQGLTSTSIRNCSATFPRLHEKYDSPIYPIALFTFERPNRLQAKEFVVKLSRPQGS